ncbi:MAG: polymer-forming cytoskeletal protein [Chloroflexota bacterium]|nr:polymer-forming cytoskeletal protein [Chloroflexota bacterium]MDE2840641.1 polymer-forming cytoskeletal protein [Chloroflexota bacterium]MDE2930100.1 polymer-forming cytoskeletal protein [Chloroflexota bacterium]
MKQRLGFAFMLAFILTLLGASAASAADFRTDTSITIGEGEVIDDDLYLLGTTLVINGTVNGDVFAAGTTVRINGTVNGNVSLAGESVTIDGTVSQGARVAANDFFMSGSVGQDLLLLGNTNAIGSSAVIGRDLILTVSSMTIDGTIERRIAGVADMVTHNGSVGAEFDISVGDLIITDGASIGGDLTYRSEKEAEIAGGAEIGGETTQEMAAETDDIDVGFSFDSIAFGVAGLIMTAVYGTVLLLIFPRLSVTASNQLLENPLMSIGMGIVFLIVVPIVSILVMITVVGIPLGLIALLLYGIALFSAQVFVGLTIGRLILSFFADGKRRLIQFFGLLIGLLILYGISFIPYVGPWAPLIVVILGLGGLMMAIGRLRHEPARGTPQPAEG